LEVRGKALQRGKVTEVAVRESVLQREQMELWESALPQEPFRRRSQEPARDFEQDELARPGGFEGSLDQPRLDSGNFPNRPK
jgi:hypothetical protein